MVTMQAKERNKMVCFLNSFVGMSGGDTRFIEVTKRMPNVDKYIITSQTGKKTCEERSLQANFILTTKENTIKNIFLTYFVRIFKSSFLNFNLSKNDCIYSSSDFLPDTLPAYFMKLRNNNAKWVTCVFLVVPSLFRDYTQSFKKSTSISIPTTRRLFYYLSQQLTISLAKSQADKVLVLNQMDKEFLLKKGVKSCKLMVVNGGVDYDQIAHIKQKAVLYDAVFLGRFHLQKGIFDLIKIWRLVCDNKPDAKLCIIGSGPKSLVERIKEEIIENGLTNNIELVGSKIGDERYSILKASKVFLCPSFYESFAIVIAEAMACGLPVIAYNLPIYEDIYESYISKVPLGNIPQFAKSILEILGNDDLRATTGTAGQKFIQKYDWVKIAQREYQLITELK